MTDQEKRRRKRYLRELSELLVQYRDPKELEVFLSAILTPSELQEVPKRLQIFKMLKRGVPQRQIADKLGVGIATVTRGSRAVQEKGLERLG